MFWQWQDVGALKFIAEGWRGRWMILAKFRKWELVLMETRRVRG